MAADTILLSQKIPILQKRGNPFSSSGRKNHEEAAPAILRPFFEEKLIFGLMCHRWWAWPPNPFWAVRIYFLPPSLPLLHNLPMWKTSFCYYTLKPCFIIVQGVPFQNGQIETTISNDFQSKVWKFKHFAFIQILIEINFDKFRASKCTVWSISEALKVAIWKNSTLKICKN